MTDNKSARDRLRIAVIGAGVAARTAHLPSIAASTDTELVGVCDSDSVRASEVARLYDVPHFADPAQMLANVVPDAVVVATPPASHAKLTIRALEAGAHVLVEKPMARTVAEAIAMRDAASSARVRLAVAHQRRYQPTCMRIGDLIAAGAVGQPYFANVHWSTNVKLDPHRLIPNGGYRGGYAWRWRDAEAGGGVVQDHLPHYLDLARYWLRQEPVEVMAVTRNLAREILGWRDEDSVWDDFALINVRFDKGFILSLEFSLAGRAIGPLFHQASGLGEWVQFGHVHGSTCSLAFDFLPWDSSEHGRIATWSIDRAGQGIGWSLMESEQPVRVGGSPAGAAGEMFAGQLDAFVSLCRGEPSTIATASDGLITIAAIEAAYASAERNAPVQLA